MIDYTLALRLRDKYRVSEDTIEKDYLIELLLNRIVDNDFLRTQLIFRGGTALKKIYFPEFRYSEDLDFITRPSDKNTAYETALTGVIDNAKSILPIELNMSDVLHPQKGHIQAFIAYNIIPEIQMEKKLKIDLVEDRIALSSKERKIIFTFDDFKEQTRKLKTYDLESVAAEKILRILDVVNEPRDLWDLLHLFKSKINVDIIKKSFYEKSGADIEVSSLLRAIKHPDYKRLWNIRLKNQIPELIDYDYAVDELVTLVKGFLSQPIP